MDVTSLSRSLFGPHGAFAAGGARPPGPPGPPPLDPDALARGLGVSVDDLRASRDAGQSLADLADSRGIGDDQLKAAVRSALTAAKPEGAPDLPAETLDALAASIATGSRPPAPPPGIGQGSFPEQSILDAIAGDGAEQRIRDLLASLEQAGGATGYTDRGTAARRTPSLGLDTLA